MKIAELLEEDTTLEEGPLADKIKRAALGGAMAAGLGYGAMQMAPKADAPVEPPKQAQPANTATTKTKPGVAAPTSIADIIDQTKDMKVKAPPPIKLPAKNKKNELMVAKAGFAAGLRGEELAAFLAQTAHESFGFNELVERGGKEYFKRMYEPQHAPKTAAILGNVKPGDGVKYHGRGFIHLTGRDNYRMAGEALGLDLLKKPQLAEKPEIAAKIAVWFWKSRVRPNVKDYRDVEAVTRFINPALRHLDSREQTYADYAKLLERVGIA